MRVCGYEPIGVDRGRPGLNDLGRFLAIAALSVTAPAVLAVTPLVVDDADPVDYGRVELHGGAQFARDASEKTYSVPLNLVFGIHEHGELGLVWGYQWLDPGVGAANPQDVHGMTDLVLSTKWRLWQTEHETFKVGLRVDFKVPTASDEDGLGNGHPDLGAVVLATWCWGSTWFDWNLGYTDTDASRVVLSDDLWFVGQAVRHPLSERWTAIGEVFGAIPNASDGGPALVQFNAGALYSLSDNLVLSGLVGTGVGEDSPDLAGYLGFSWQF